MEMNESFETLGSFFPVLCVDSRLFYLQLNIIFLLSSRNLFRAYCRSFVKTLKKTTFLRWAAADARSSEGISFVAQ